MSEYEINVTGTYGIIILTPEIITRLIEKTRNSAKRKLHIPAEEILPPGYADYLLRVLEANFKLPYIDASITSRTRILSNHTAILATDISMLCSNYSRSQMNGVYMEIIYELAAIQLKQLRFRQQTCFDHVSLYKRQHHTQFELLASNAFYILAKQKIHCITYIYPAMEGTPD